jgi:CRISPR-associated protein Csb1
MKITTPADFDKFGYIGAITELEPASGAFGPVCPPTYSPANENDKHWAAKLALTEGMTVPSREHGWSDVERDATNVPRRGRAVLINAIGAEAHQLGQVLFHDSGIDWGRFAVKPLDAAGVDAMMTKHLKEVPDADTIREVVRESLTTHQYDSWTASHRLADASIRYADDPATGRQMWHIAGDLRGKIQRINPRQDADWVWCNAANALIFGFWLSITDHGVRPKWARALSSEIVGYGVFLLKTGATKGSELGAVSNTLKVSVEEGELKIAEEKKKSAGKKDKDSPSNFGVGPIPTSPDDAAVSCEVILRRAGVSLTHLRQIRSASGQERAIVRAAAAASMFALAVVSTRNVFLRSGTDLAPVSTKWTGRAEDGSTVTLEVDVEGAKSVLHAAMADLEAAGLPQAGAIELVMSDALAKVYIDAIVSDPKGDSN